MNAKLITKTDIIIITAVLLTAGLLFFIPKIQNPSASDPQKTVIITENGDTVYKIKLSDLKEEQIYSLGNMQISVSPDGAKITQSDCKDKICMRTGLLKNNGDTAVCVPNKVTVKIVTDGKNSKNDIDAVAY